MRSIKSVKTKKALKIYLLELIEENKPKISFNEQAGDLREAGKMEGMSILASQITENFLLDVDTGSVISSNQEVFYRCIELYKSFAKYLTNSNPKITPFDYIELRKIIAYLRTIDESDDSVKANFEVILRAWNRLPSNYRNFIKLSQINKNLFGIISYIQLKQINKDQYSQERKRQEQEFEKIAKRYSPTNAE